MFVLAMYIYHCNKVTTTPYLLYSTSAMFILGTMQITLKVVIAAIVLHTVKLAVQGGSLVRSTSVHDRLAFVRYLILNANKSVGGTLLFYMGLKVIKSRSALTDSLFVRSRPHLPYSSKRPHRFIAATWSGGAPSPSYSCQSPCWSRQQVR